MVYTYTTPQLVQAELQSSVQFTNTTTPTEATIQNWIYEESAYINSLTNNIYGSTSLVEYVDYEGSDDLFTEESPIQSLTSLEYNIYPLGSTLGSSWVTKTLDTHYTLYADRGVIRIIRNRFVPEEGSKRFRITYVSGYDNIPAEVQMLSTKLVALRCLETLTMKNVNERNDGGSVSVGSISIIEPSSYGVNTLKQLQSQINELKKEVLGSSFSVFRFMHI